jgi:hypothetical protein
MPAFYPFEDRVRDLFLGFPCLPVGWFYLHDAPERFHHGIAVADAGRSRRAGQPGIAQPITVYGWRGKDHLPALLRRPLEPPGCPAASTGHWNYDVTSGATAIFTPVRRRARRPQRLSGERGSSTPPVGRPGAPGARGCPGTARPGDYARRRRNLRRRPGGGAYTWSHRIDPADLAGPREAGVVGAHLKAVFDGERRQMRVADDVAPSWQRVIRSFRMRACPGPSRGIQETSGSSQSSMKPAACPGVSGFAELVHGC